MLCRFVLTHTILNSNPAQAIAAGAGMILTPNTIMPMTALNFLSPDGKCFTFDSRANGYGRGEGIGVVVLKRVEDAIKNNDHIRAIIRASQVNQDGRTKGIFPSLELINKESNAVQELHFPARKRKSQILRLSTKMQVFLSRTLGMSNATGLGHRLEIGESSRQYLKPSHLCEGLRTPC